MRTGSHCTDSTACPRWNATSVVNTKYYPGTATAMSDGAKGYGATAIALIGISAVVALYTAYTLLAKGASNQMPETGPALYYATMCAGVVVLLTSLALYAGLAIGAHNELAAKGKGTDLSVSLWPHPSWAFAGAFLSGICLVCAA